MPQVSLPLKFRGSTITHNRVSGPPSKVYPFLRDLGDLAEPAELNPRNNFSISVEIDTARGRDVGILEMVTPPSGGYQERCVMRTASGERMGFAFPDIIAVRVRSIEVEDMPYELPGDDA